VKFLFHKIFEKFTAHVLDFLIACKEPCILAGGPDSKKGHSFFGGGKLGHAFSRYTQQHVAMRPLATRTVATEKENSHHTMVVVIPAHLPTGHLLFHARVLLSATAALLSQDRACGTVCRLL